MVSPMSSAQTVLATLGVEHLSRGVVILRLTSLLISPPWRVRRQIPTSSGSFADPPHTCSFFSPWKYSIDAAARTLLEPQGWIAPDPETYPTGHDLLVRYLTPLAETPAIASHLRLGARVVSVTRRGFDKMKTAGREEAPFLLQLSLAEGQEEVILGLTSLLISPPWRVRRQIPSSSGSFADPPHTCSFFSPWKYSIDAAARTLLEPQGWIAPDPETYPTGHDLLVRYLTPLAETPAIA